jgi:valyl-tRNA synthetase
MEQAKVTVRGSEGEGGLDLGKELEAEMKGVAIPPAQPPEIAKSIAMLKEGTKEGLSASDHYDLGVAYMGMGLVDEAVDEFNRAKGAAVKKAAKVVKQAKSKVKAVAAKIKAAVGKKSAGAKKAAKAKTKKPAKAKKPTQKAKAAKKPAKAKKALKKAPKKVAKRTAKKKSRK